MIKLDDRKCVPCEGGVPPLNERQVSQYLDQVAGWQTNKVGKKINKDFKFPDFVTAILFVNEVGRVAEEEGHHPDLNIHDYNQVTVTLSTHAIGGLSENDFIMAAKVDGEWKDQE